MRGIGIYAGGFPNEYEMMAGNINYVEKAFYGYLAGIIALTVGGAIFQIHRDYHRDLNDYWLDMEASSSKYVWRYIK